MNWTQNHYEGVTVVIFAKEGGHSQKYVHFRKELQFLMEKTVNTME